MPFYRTVALDEETYRELIKLRDSMDFVNQKPSITAAIKKLIEERVKKSEG